MLIVYIKCIFRCDNSNYVCKLLFALYITLLDIHYVSSQNTLLFCTASALRDEPRRMLRDVQRLANVVFAEALDTFHYSTRLISESRSCELKSGSENPRNIFLFYRSLFKNSREPLHCCQLYCSTTELYEHRDSRLLHGHQILIPLLVRITSVYSLILCNLEYISDVTRLSVCILTGALY
jgi:hypothetical protein